MSCHIYRSTCSSYTWTHTHKYIRTHTACLHLQEHINVYTHTHTWTYVYSHWIYTDQQNQRPGKDVCGKEEFNDNPRPLPWSVSVSDGNTPRMKGCIAQCQTNGILPGGCDLSRQGKLKLQLVLAWAHCNGLVACWLINGPVSAASTLSHSSVSLS